MGPQAQAKMSSEDIGSMSVKELKGFISAHGLDFSDCVEKADLIARAKEAASKGVSKAPGSPAAVGKCAAEAAPNIMRFSAPSLSKRAIHDVARDGDEAMVTKLLTDASNLDVADQEGHTPLMLAAWEGHTPIVKLLIGRGADLDLRNKVGNSALHLASWWGRVETMQQLLEAGASIGAIDADGDFALHHAARNNMLEAVQLLIQWGAPAGVKNKAGKTPMVLALECNHVETALELEKHTATK